MVLGNVSQTCAGRYIGEMRSQQDKDGLVEEEDLWPKTPEILYLWSDEVFGEETIYCMKDQIWDDWPWEAACRDIKNQIKYVLNTRRLMFGT